MQGGGATVLDRVAVLSLACMCPSIGRGVDSVDEAVQERVEENKVVLVDMWVVFDAMADCPSVCLPASAMVGVLVRVAVSVALVDVQLSEATVD